MSEFDELVSLDFEEIQRNLRQLVDWYWECDANFHFTKFKSFHENYQLNKLEQALLNKKVWAPDQFVELSLEPSNLERMMRAGENIKGLIVGYFLQEEDPIYVCLCAAPRIDEHSRITGYFGFVSIVDQLQEDYLVLRQFRTAMDESGDAIYLADVKTLKFVDVNTTACRRMGYSREQLLTLGPPDLLSVTAEVIRKEYMELIRSGGKGFKSESIAFSRTGSRMIAEMHRRPVKVGGRWLVISIARDITERKFSELASIRKSRMYSALSAAEEAVAFAKTHTDLYQKICSAVVEGGKLSTMAIFLLNEHNGMVEYVSGSGFCTDKLSQINFAIDGVESGDSGLLGRACEIGGPAVLEEAFENAETIAGEKYSKALKFESVVAIPFSREGKLTGVGLFCSGEKEWFDGEVIYILQRMIGSMVHGLEKLDLEAAKLEERDRFEYMSKYDALTNLPNRKYFLEKLESTLEIAQQSNRRFALMFIDLDGFKAINDNFGHDFGDALLVELASRFRKALRENDFVARLGGDEFVIIATDARVESSMIVIAEKLLQEAARPVLIKDKSCAVSASIGISFYTDKLESSATLLKKADGAMYNAKSEGKNRYAVAPMGDAPSSREGA